VSSYPLEAVARIATGPLWFQLYPPVDRNDCIALIRRVQVAGYKALCVTVDGAVLGTRERDRCNRLQIPFRWTPRLVVDGVLHPRWTADFMRSGAMAVSRSSSLSPKSIKASGRAIQATANPITADTIRYIRDAWNGPLLVKGILREEEVEEIIELDVQGIVVSNHGGRQLDSVPATIEALPEIVAAARGRVDVYVDGGFRRGTDVLKAIALGARAVLIGRPYLFALAVGGESGVVDMLELMRDEIDTAMALLGCASIGEVDPSMVRIGSPWQAGGIEREFARSGLAGATSGLAGAASGLDVT
jgi:isopentenyl diphosphate isomerase/L-lactate dehydrogenase-like FMN-dependent dehydrogenase